MQELMTPYFWFLWKQSYLDAMSALLPCQPMHAKVLSFAPVQVHHVFKHLDLNNDNTVSKDELAVFLKHLFTEQLKVPGCCIMPHAHTP